MVTASKRRALCFFWGSPSLINGIAEFCGYFSREFDVEFFIITNSLSGRMFFLREGLQAFTIGDLIKLSLEGESAVVDESEANDLLYYDLFTGQGAAKDACEVGIASYANRVLKAYSLLVDNLEPDLFFVWNGSTFWQRALAYVARKKGAACYFLERGLIPGTFVVDPDGVNYSSSLAGTRWHLLEIAKPTGEERARLEDFLFHAQQSNRTVVMHGKELGPLPAREHLGIPQGAKVVLLPLQIETDSNILFHSPCYRTMPQVIADLQSGLENVKDVFLVIKPHPEDIDRLEELTALCGPRCCLSIDLSLSSLLGIADVVTTINSTVGLEALIKGKQVVALGRAIYTEKGFTFDVSGPEDLPSQLDRALKVSGREDKPSAEFQRFLVYLLKTHLFPISGHDEWGSRTRIGRKIAGHVSPGGSSALSLVESPLLKSMMDQNMVLAGLFSPSASKKKRVLFFFASQKTIDLIHLCSADNLSQSEELKWSASKIPSLVQLGKRYDFLISDKRFSGWKRLVFNVLWTVIRSKKKIFLCSS